VAAADGSGPEDEIMPKNIIMIGPTGCGKTEDRAAIGAAVGPPFVKVEASKFTEVGYVGRDVDEHGCGTWWRSRDAGEDEERERVRRGPRSPMEDRLLDLLVPPPRFRARRPWRSPLPGHQRPPNPAAESYRSAGALPGDASFGRLEEQVC